MSCNVPNTVSTLSVSNGTDLKRKKLSPCLLCTDYSSGSTQLSHHCHFLHLVFSNVISKSEVKALAEADEQEVVAEVQVSTFVSI